MKSTIKSGLGPFGGDKILPPSLSTTDILIHFRSSGQVWYLAHTLYGTPPPIRTVRASSHFGPFSAMCMQRPDLAIAYLFSPPLQLCKIDFLCQTHFDCCMPWSCTRPLIPFISTCRYVHVLIIIASTNIAREKVRGGQRSCSLALY